MKCTVPDGCIQKTTPVTLSGTAQEKSLGRVLKALSSLLFSAIRYNLYHNLVIKVQFEIRMENPVSTRSYQNCRGVGRGFRVRDPLTVKTRSRTNQQVWVEQQGTGGLFPVAGVKRST